MELAFVGNNGHGFTPTTRTSTSISPQSSGFGTIPRDERRPYFSKYGWTQDISDYRQ